MNDLHQRLLSSIVGHARSIRELSILFPEADTFTIRNAVWDLVRAEKVKLTADSKVAVGDVSQCTRDKCVCWRPIEIDETAVI